MAVKFELIDAGIGESFRSTRLRMLFDYWSRLAVGDVPARSDFDPTEVKPLLPFMLVVGLTDEPLRIHYRLVGTEVVKFTGMEFTGRYLDEFRMDDFGVDELTQQYRTVRDARRPGIGSTSLNFQERPLVETEYLICPISSTPPKVDMCLAIEDYFLAAGTSWSDLPAAQWLCE